MNDSLKKQLAVFILAIIAATVFMACGKTSKIVGTWKRTDATEEGTSTFTTGGDYILNKPGSTVTAKYELKNDTLQIRYVQAKDGRDVDLKIVKLDDSLMELETEIAGKKSEAKFEKVGTGATGSKTPEAAKEKENRKPDVPEAAVTEPWASMNLPCKNTGIVSFSDERRFDCAYGGKQTRERDIEIVNSYAEIFKKDGWKITGDLPDVAVSYTFEKDGKELFISSTGGSTVSNGKLIEWKGFGVQMSIQATKK